MQSIDISKVKLIIWDLDDTFWNGTISENEISMIDQNIDLVKMLTDCGIINSICSKNDYDVAKEALENAKIWDFFVCPSINWESKGTRVKDQISSLQLRDCNVLFIDDNITNINEVKFYNPNIMTAQPDILNSLYKTVSSLMKTDLKHDRLNRYKILEKKLQKKNQANSNIEFLYECNISVTIHHNCMDELERIHELLLRTNQLNFTKNRSTIEELSADLNNKQYKCGYVNVSDDYGDYGIVGFYCLDKSRLKHFVFSCRCMGMGIEQYVYSELNYPQLEIVGEVSTSLNSTRPGWINVSSSSNVKAKKEVSNTVQVLFKGPCDMSQIFSFIKEDKNIDCEFTYASSTGVSIEQHNHSQCILQSLSIDDGVKKQIISELPFGDENMYSQKMFSQKYDVIVFSTLSDCGLGLYKRKTGEYVAFGEYIHPLTDEAEWDGYIKKTTPSSNCSFSLEQLQYIKSNYEYVGRLSPDKIVENIKSILNHLDKHTHLILLLGSEVPYQNNVNANYNDRHLFHKMLNDKIKDLALTEPRLRYIEFTKYVKSQNDFFNNINHFMKNVYYNVSKEIISDIKAISNVSILGEGFIKVVRLFVNQLIRKIIHRF